MDTIEVLVEAKPELHDHLVAELADLGYEGFLQTESHLTAYVPADRDSARLRDLTRRTVKNLGSCTPVNFSLIRERNWNEEWERSATAVEVGRFIILPTWSTLDVGDREPLWIDPKMSFGTGHHESTRLALRLMEKHFRSGSLVLDAGSGTGILSIAAVRLGARSVTAFDIDPWAAENFAENVMRNGVSDRVSFVSGDMGSVTGTGFDLIVANINRNVLVEICRDMSDRLRDAGRLILSGVLKSDRDSMIRVGEACSLALADEATEGPWWAAVFSRLEGPPDV